MRRANHADMSKYRTDWYDYYLIATDSHYQNMLATKLIMVRNTNVQKWTYDPDR